MNLNLINRWFFESQFGESLQMMYTEIWYPQRPTIQTVLLNFRISQLLILSEP
jgi:hypothetical protein